MIRIAIITNIRSPYRKLQVEEFSRKGDSKITVYYTDSGYEDRNWNVKPIENVKETYLKKLLSFGKYGFLNYGLFKVVYDNDLILIGGYQMPSYIILVLLCRLYHKKSVLIFDGISVNKIKPNNEGLLEKLKGWIIKKYDYFFANGEVSRRYLTQTHNITENSIFNQVLTVDIATIMNHKISKEDKAIYRAQNNIEDKEKVILYCGRLVSIKRVDLIIQAIALLDNKDNYKLVILGDGKERQKLEELSVSLGVNINIMGFTANQEELFHNYNLGDILILPSDYEPWGLVVNEAMAAGLPVIVSDNCGCSLDLVKNGYNGYTFNKGDATDLSEKLQIIFEGDYQEMGRKSSELIRKWSFENSCISFQSMIRNITSETSIGRWQHLNK